MKPRPGYEVEYIGDTPIYVRRMDIRTRTELKRTLGEANAAMARYIRGVEGIPKKPSQAQLAELELQARVALAHLAACIETEGVL